jgi:translation initiation factor IF-1
MKEDSISVTGTVTEDLPGLEFLVSIENTKSVVRCYISGKMRRHKIKLVPGDAVDVELSPYDLTRGRIVFRKK